MAWKLVCEKVVRRQLPLTNKSNKEVDKAELEAWLCRQSSVTGKNLRVTVEEEVDECCERWRGRVPFYVLTYSSDGNGHYGMSDRACAFCPECGRKL